MPKWMWVALSLALSSGIYFSIRYGLRPKPIPLLNPTVFDRADQIGIVAYRALQPSLRQERILVLGSTPSLPEYEAIWDGFIRAAIADGVKIDSVFERADLKLPESLKNFSGVHTVSEADLASPDFVKQVMNAYQRGEMALMQVLSLEATHLIAGTVTNRLQALPELPVVSVSMLPLAVRQEDFEQLQPHCLDPRDDAAASESRLWCAASRISRSYLRKHLTADKWVAAVERHGFKEYLLFVSSPH